MTDTNGSTMHCESEQAEMRPCAYCAALFRPRRPWERFCKGRCRDAYNVDFGTHGHVRSVRRLRRGVSVVVHIEDDAAERALKFGIKDAVLLVRRP